MESMPSLFSDLGHDQQPFNNHYEMPPLDLVMCNGPFICDNCYCGVTEHEELYIDPLPPLSFTGSLLELQEQHYSDDWHNIYFPSPVATEHDHESSMSMVSSVSTFTCPIVSSTPEQFEEAEGLNSMEGACHAKSVFAPHGNNISSSINVTDPGVPVLPAELSIPGSVGGCSRTCAGCVWPASACHEHRLTASEVERQRFYKGVKKTNSDKWTCEIRISKKIQKDRKLQEKDKLWLGTFDTRDQAARALHVGRFLLSVKKRPTDTANFEQNSKNILSEFKDLLQAQPLDAELLQKVKDLATDYDC